MTQQPVPAHAAPATDTPARRGRRALIAGAATAAVGAVGVALARPADAAAGSALVLGRTNTSGTAQTVVTSTNTTATVNVRGSGGTGVLGDTSTNTKWGVHGRNTSTTSSSGGAVRGEGRVSHGVRGDTTSPNRFGVLGVSAAATTGSTGSALRGDGRQNPGLWASTVVDTVPAVFADGHNGAGVALLAFGTADVEGLVFGLDVQVGVVSGPVNAAVINEASVASGAQPYHLETGSVTLSATGTATVALPAAVVDAADLTKATVTLTGVGAPVGGAFVATLSSTGFTVSGGANAQALGYLVVAPRRDVFAVTLAKAGAKTLRHHHGIHVPTA